jgi:hypothetical protein
MYEIDLGFMEKTPIGLISSYSNDQVVGEALRYALRRWAAKRRSRGSEA